MHKTGKRKRPSPPAASAAATTLQIVVGTYERVLHGFTATIPSSGTLKDDVESSFFSDAFLFNAHISAIRCLALAPPTSHKRVLATGSSDERINLYALSTRAPKTPTLAARDPLRLPSEAPRSRELGSLMHHTSTVTTLSFPSSSKLLSASNDNTIGVTRSRDWALLSTIKAPVPTTAGRPSGDTFAPGEVPAGINDLAVHPSAKLAITVGIGEKCMRLWDLVRGKKAGVLTFERTLLSQIGEAKYRGGEGRQVTWRTDGAEFAVAFEKGVLIYGIDCQIRGTISLGARGRVCQIRYLPASGNDEEPYDVISTLAVSTEDGRVLFYDTSKQCTPSSASEQDGNASPSCTLLAQIVVSQRGSGSRIKDFRVLPVTTEQSRRLYIMVTASSDGTVTVWEIPVAQLRTFPSAINGHQSSKKPKLGAKDSTVTPSTPPSIDTNEDVPSIGTVLGVHQTQRRITCLEAFIMEPYVGEEPSPSPEVELDSASSDEDESDHEDGVVIYEDEDDIGSGSAEDTEDEEEGDEFVGFDDNNDEEKS